jgi:hypothetical protein
MDATVNVQARLSICSLATLASAYVSEGNILRSKSDLIWKAVEHLVGLYEEQGIERITDVYEAVAYMEKIGLYLDSSKRTTRQIQTALVKANAMADFGTPDFGRAITKRALLSKEREEYDIAAAAIKAQGLVPISFEQFLENKRKKETVVETVNEGDFAKKEKDRLAAEKAAYSPEALLSTMLVGREDKGGE